MNDILETLKRILIGPERTNPVEVIAHEAIEFVTYGSIYHALAKWFEGEDEDDDE